MLGLLVPSKFDWGFYITSFAKTALIFTLHVCKSTISSSMEHCCNIRAGVHRYYSDMLDKMQKWVCRTVGFSFASFLESMSHGWKVANKVFSIGIALLDFHLNWLDWVQLLIGDLLVHSVRLGIDWVLGSWKNILHY